jgi:hypothetical protein
MDGARAGRPRRLAEWVERVLVTVLEMEPHTQGYRAAQWTTRLLCQYLREQQACVVSAVTVRRCLHRLGYRWKRPRYVLARRSRYWCQAKGGSGAAPKGSGLANRASQAIDEAADAACGYILALTPRQRLQQVGALSGHFWLAT